MKGESEQTNAFPGVSYSGGYSALQPIRRVNPEYLISSVFNTATQQSQPQHSYSANSLFSNAITLSPNFMIWKYVNVFIKYVYVG